MLAGLLLLTVLAMSYGHSVNFGECPTATPFPDFDMSKFLGKWYVIQKTSKSTQCMTENYTPSSESQKFILEMISEHSTLRLLGMGNKYRFSGDLTVPNPDTPAKMHAKLPLGLGSASYTVFDTDYDTYGAVFACQNLLFGVGNRQAITILSRHPTLDKTYIDKIKRKASAFGIETSDLSVINQNNCHGEKDSPQVEVSVNNGEIGGVLHKGREMKRNEDEPVTEEPKKIYSDEFVDVDIRSRFNPGSEEVIENPDNNEAEWLP